MFRWALEAFCQFVLLDFINRKAVMTFIVYDDMKSVHLRAEGSSYYLQIASWVKSHCLERGRPGLLMDACCTDATGQ